MTNTSLAVSLGKSSSAAIERVSRQTVALVRELLGLYGPGAFINVEGDLLEI